MAPKPRLDKSAADRVREAARAAAVEDSSPSASPVQKAAEASTEQDATSDVGASLVDALGRPTSESMKERVTKFNSFTKTLGESNNAQVAGKFVRFSIAMFTLPVIVFVMLHNVVLPRIGDVRIATPLMEDDDGNIVPDLEWTDPSTMGAAHTVVTLYGVDRTVWAGVAAVLVVIAIKIAFVISALREDDRNTPEVGAPSSRQKARKLPTGSAKRVL